MSTQNSLNTCIELDVPAIEPLSREAGAFVLHEIVKHFLFMRSQLPGLFDDLWWQYEVRHLFRELYCDGYREIIQGLALVTSKSLLTCGTCPVRVRKHNNLVLKGRTGRLCRRRDAYPVSRGNLRRQAA